jgi:hypothetical protein
MAVSKKQFCVVMVSGALFAVSLTGCGSTSDASTMTNGHRGGRGCGQQNNQDSRSGCSQRGGRNSVPATFASSRGSRGHGCSHGDSIQQASCETSCDHGQGHGARPASCGTGTTCSKNGVSSHGCGSQHNCGNTGSGCRESAPAAERGPGRGRGRIVQASYQRSGRGHGAGCSASERNAGTCGSGHSDCDHAVKSEPRKCGSQQQCSGADTAKADGFSGFGFGRGRSQRGEGRCSASGGCDENAGACDKTESGCNGQAAIPVPGNSNTPSSADERDGGNKASNDPS